jgi:hypothetical protein
MSWRGRAAEIVQRPRAGQIESPPTVSLGTLLLSEGRFLTTPARSVILLSFNRFRFPAAGHVWRSSLLNQVELRLSAVDPVPAARAKCGVFFEREGDDLIAPFGNLGADVELD